MPDSTTPRITTFVLGEYATNCHVVTAGDDARRCWVIDCGDEPEPLLRHLDEQALTVQDLLLTHCHADHIAGTDALLARCGELPIHVHAAEARWCGDPMLNLSAMSGTSVTVTEPDRRLHDGDVLELDGTAWRVVHAPGHSPGGVLFVHDDSEQAIVGDTLFAGSIGRFDFPTSCVEDLQRTILETMMSLPDEMRIFPGHGPTTTIGHERRTNPFIVGGAAGW